ncbi:uncharacterized protein LOC135393502 isoform X2 [Ornithodoros turicata]
MMNFLCNKRRAAIKDATVPRRTRKFLPPFEPVPHSPGRTLFCVYDHEAARKQRPHPYDGNDRLPYLPRHLPLSYCRYVIYSSLAVEAKGGVAYKWPDFDAPRGVPGLVRQVTRHHYNTSLLVTIGGSDLDNWNLSRSTYLPKSSHQLAQRVRGWLQRNRFHGANIHWPEPGNRCGRPSDKRQLVGFVRTLRRILGHKYIITITLPPSHDIVSSGFDLDALSKDADYLLATTHDYNNLTSKTVQCPSSVSQVDSTLRFLSERVPQRYWNKVCPSVSLAGTVFIGDGPGLNVSVRRPSRHLAHYEFCTSWQETSNVDDCGVNQRVLELGLVETVVYETTRSLAVKMEVIDKHAAPNGEACVVVYDVDSDDVVGVCSENGVQSPVTRALYLGQEINDVDSRYIETVAEP